jgi:signal transduction histidine kinase
MGAFGKSFNSREPSAAAPELPCLDAQAQGENQELLIQALRTALAEGKAAARAKGAFLASVSHELRTPLNGIIGFAEMIQRDVWKRIGDERYIEYGRDIAQSARRLQRILDDILEMARLEAGRARVQRDSLSISDIFEESLAWARDRVSNAPPKVEVRIGREFPTLWTDRRHLRQIVVNLLTNALQFTPETGEVDLGAHVTPSGEIEISVADSGSGMTPEQVKLAVTRFGHVESEETRSGGGIGLGLPLAKSLTALLGGDLRVHSELGAGTTVVAAFPSASMKPPQNFWQRSP